MTVSDASLDESGSKLSKVAATSLLMGVTRGSSDAYIRFGGKLLSGSDGITGTRDGYDYYDLDDDDDPEQ